VRDPINYKIVRVSVSPVRPYVNGVNVNVCTTIDTDVEDSKDYNDEDEDNDDNLAKR